MPESIENKQPEKINTPANKDLVKSPEKEEAKFFTPEDIESLTNDGYLLFELSPKSIKELRKEGYHIEIDPTIPEIEDLRGSINGHVAIKPGNPILHIQGTEKESLEIYSNEVTDKYPRTKARMVNPVDATTLLHEYRERTGKNLLVGDFVGDSIITDCTAFPWQPQPSGNGRGTIVTQKKDGVISINNWGGGHGGEFMRLPRVVVPA